MKIFCPTCNQSRLAETSKNKEIGHTIKCTVCGTNLDAQSRKIEELEAEIESMKQQGGTPPP